jgi:carboxymethylenebutenolidase
MGKILFILITIALILAGAWYVLVRSDEDVPSNVETSQMQEYEVTTSKVEYFGTTTGFLATPQGDGPFPAVILIHEWWGLNSNMEELAQDFAHQGYVALAVDLYTGRVADTPTTAGTYASEVRANVEGAFSNLRAAVAYLRAQQYVADEKIASVGWCFGGGWAYEMARNNLGVAASVMYYGRFSPDDDLEMMKAHILGHFGEEDTSISVNDAQQFEAKLKTHSNEHAIFIYPNAGHGFANENNKEAYNEEAAVLAWDRTLEFLKKELR